MTDEEIRFEVARRNGWTQVWWDDSFPDVLLGTKDDNGIELPDYPNDLNACAEFENAIIKKNAYVYLAYSRHLSKICGGDMDAQFATARERCLAFIQTMEKEIPF